MQNDSTRRRVPTWLVALASAVLGVALGAGVLSAGAQGEPPAPGAEPDRRAAIEAFVPARRVPASTSPTCAGTVGTGPR